jgi:hypothetical protein
MPAPLFLQAKVIADQKARNLRSHAAWRPALFKALRSVLAGKSRVEIYAALQDARGCIEQRSLFIPQDRILLLQDLNTLEKELLGSHAPV